MPKSKKNSTAKNSNANNSNPMNSSDQGEPVQMTITVAPDEETDFDEGSQACAQQEAPVDAADNPMSPKDCRKDALGHMARLSLAESRQTPPMVSSSSSAVTMVTPLWPEHRSMQEQDKLGRRLMRATTDPIRLAAGVREHDPEEGEEDNIMNAKDPPESKPRDFHVREIEERERVLQWQQDQVSRGRSPIGIYDARLIEQVTLEHFQEFLLDRKEARAESERARAHVGTMTGPDLAGPECGECYRLTLGEIPVVSRENLVCQMGHEAMQSLFMRIDTMLRSILVLGPTMSSFCSRIAFIVENYHGKLLALLFQIISASAMVAIFKLNCPEHVETHCVAAGKRRDIVKLCERLYEKPPADYHLLQVKVHQILQRQAETNEHSPLVDTDALAKAEKAAVDRDWEKITPKPQPAAVGSASTIDNEFVLFQRFAQALVISQATMVDSVWCRKLGLFFSTLIGSIAVMSMMLAALEFINHQLECHGDQGSVPVGKIVVCGNLCSSALAFIEGAGGLFSKSKKLKRMSSHWSHLATDLRVFLRLPLHFDLDAKTEAFKDRADKLVNQNTGWLRKYHYHGGHPEVQAKLEEIKKMYEPPPLV